MQKVALDDRWILVDAGPNPSTDYFVKPWLAAQERLIHPMHWQEAPPAGPPAPGTSILFVRYLSKPWQQWVSRHRAQFKQVVYFMDDDLFDLASWSGQRWQYRWRLYQRAYRFQSWLKATGARLWVSTSALANKYDDWQPQVLLPESPYKFDRTPQSTENSIIFYHGSASHEAEMKWLLPVLDQVLAQHESAIVEVIADARTKRHFQPLVQSYGQRMKVVPPMPWPDYQRFVTGTKRTVGLAPLIDTPFNCYRAPTKRFDIEAAGAMGIFADHPALNTAPETALAPHRRVPMNQELWVDAVLSCLQD
ncbi:MAG: glycosyltransferase family 1 protein [Saccharospirillum sp.]|nr:glycosyltransferase family 1 protein [Saccharospirillum sp.]